MYVLLCIFYELARYHYFKEDIHSGMTVLHQVTKAFKTFILNIKEAVPISAKLSLKFVKKGTKVPRSSAPVRILHHVSDWGFF